MRPKRILVTSFFYEFRYGGAELVARTLKRNLEKRAGLEVDVVCFAGSPVREPEPNIHRLSLPAWWMVRSQLFKRAVLFLNNGLLDRWIANRIEALRLDWPRYDLLHCQDFNAIRVSGDLAARHGKPLVLTLHDGFPKALHPGQSNSLLTRVINRGLRQRAETLRPVLLGCRPIVCVSQFVQRSILRFLGSGQPAAAPVVIYSPIEEYLQHLAPAPGASQSGQAQRLLFVGRLSKEKGVHLLVEALNRLPHPITLSVLGLDGPLRSWLQACAGRNPRVQMLAPVPHEQIQRFMLEHEVICCPSLFEEPFGKTVLEARLTSKPVVATNLGGIPEIAARYPRAILIDPQHKSEEALVRSLAEAIQRALVLAATPLDQAAERHFLSQFQMDAALEAYLEVYQTAGR